MEESIEIRKEIFRKYNRNPLDWRVFAGVDKNFYQDFTIVHDREVWFLKEMMLNPEKTVGFGIRERLGSSISESTLASFGLREIRPADINPHTNVDDLLAKILARQPKPVTSLFGRENFILQGPVAMGRPKELEEPYGRVRADLQKRLDELIVRKYPHLKTIYG
jgi:hypothetical protein